jgi:N-acetylglucosamine kinase-like BadF-type ATPase
MTGSHFLGVDGGGTKTSFVLIDRNRQVVAQHKGGSSYHLQTGLIGLRNVLAEGVDALKAAAGISAQDIEHAFFGLPAYGEDMAFDPRINALPRQLLGHDRYTCGNDMVCGWAGSLGCADGINVVAGTGSIGYGERAGVSARGGGWGEVFSDEGSAYWIAVQALNLFTKMSDGRATKGPLYHIFRAHFELQDDLHICGKVMSYGVTTRDEIAALAQLVRQAAEQGDHRAIALFNQAARELFEIVDTIRRALRFEEAETVPVSYSGGVFKAGDVIMAPFQKLLSEARHHYQLVEPKFSPCVGAALYAESLSMAQAQENLVQSSG